MNLSYRWLGELLDLADRSADDVHQLLTFHAAEVEDTRPVGAELDDVRTACVLAVRPHPNADALRLCTVQIGPGEEAEVVCGAPNVAAGQIICYAPEGAKLPGGPDGPIRLERRAIRGVESCGMICSERELGLGDDHEGILVLPPDTPRGVPCADGLGVRDTVLDVANSSITHRPDLWGHVGFARELGALLRRPVDYPPVLDADELPTEGEPFPITIESGDDCRRYVGLVIENVRNGPSPLRLRRRLESLGVRSISLLVDLTNLVLLEQGQPLHAFDLRDVCGGRIEVRRARAGETMRTLDGIERALCADDLVIADGDSPIAIAGVMGGERCEVRPDTTAILLESATFDPVRVRRTALRLGLRTEASSRFEKALDPEQALAGALRFAALLAEHVPEARFSRPLSDVYPNPYPSLEIELPYGLVRKRLGLRIPDLRAKAHLTALGFRVKETHDGMEVGVPSWRATRDITCAADLVEEVGRVEGYDGIGDLAPILPMAPKRPRPIRALERRVAALLSLEMGYAEVKRYSFYGAKEAEAVGLGATPHLAVQNPSSADHDRMLLTAAANLLRSVERNHVREARGRLWESARLFVPRPGGLPDETAILAAVTWDKDAAEDAHGDLFLTLVDDMRVLARRLGEREPEVTQGDDTPLRGGLPAPIWLHPGRRALLRVDGEVLATVGEVAPSVMRAFQLTGRAAVAEIASEVLLAFANAARSPYQPILRFPVVPFDVAVVVPRKTPAGDVRETIRAAVDGSIRGLHVFDIYEGEGIAEGHRSLALRCELYDRDGTLSPERAETLRARIVSALTDAGWSVRSA